MTPLYGHDETNPVVVPDYPYGGKRTEIRFWMEKNPKKGFRFCHQTKNPKTGSWNAVKKSTYAELAGCLYADDSGHTTWDRLTPYSSATQVLEFIKNFPGADRSLLRPFVTAKVAYYQALVNTRATYQVSINGVPQPQSEAEREAEITRNQETLVEWKTVLAVL
jgi:hypothetical protein